MAIPCSSSKARSPKMAAMMCVCVLCLVPDNLLEPFESLYDDDGAEGWKLKKSMYFKCGECVVCGASVVVLLCLGGCGSTFSGKWWWLCKML